MLKGPTEKRQHSVSLCSSAHLLPHRRCSLSPPPTLASIHLSPCLLFLSLLLLLSSYLSLLVVALSLQKVLLRPEVQAVRHSWTSTGRYTGNHQTPTPIKCSRNLIPQMSPPTVTWIIIGMIKNKRPPSHGTSRKEIGTPLRNPEAAATSRTAHSSSGTCHPQGISAIMALGSGGRGQSINASVSCSCPQQLQLCAFQ